MRPHTLRDALVGLVYIAVIVGLVALSIMVYNHDFTKYVNVDLHTDSVGNSLQNGSDVKVRGVLVGQVDDITTSGAGAIVHLQLNPADVRTLPSNMQAQLIPKTLFGERFVSLVFPSNPSSSHLSSGSSIEQDRSARSVELEKLFSDLLPVLRAVKPEKLSASLGELSAALRGRGGELADTMRVVGTYLDDLAPHVPQITADLAAFARVARTYSDAAPDLIAGLNSLTTTSRTFVSLRSQYRDVLSSVTSMSNTVGAFVGTNEDQIIGLSRTSLPSLRITARYASEFPCITRALTNYIPVADQAFGAGTSRPGAHVILHVIPRVQPYTTTSDTPTFNDDGGPRCPYAPTTALANTALAAVPGVAGANTEPSTSAASNTSRTPAAAGMGTANSPQENQLIAELVAPTAGIAPSAYPRWASLLLGPALRGAEVSVR